MFFLIQGVCTYSLHNDQSRVEGSNISFIQVDSEATNLGVTNLPLDI